MSQVAGGSSSIRNRRRRFVEVCGAGLQTGGGPGFHRGGRTLWRCGALRHQRSALIPGRRRRGRRHTLLLQHPREAPSGGPTRAAERRLTPSVLGTLRSHTRDCGSFLRIDMSSVSVCRRRSLCHLSARQAACRRALRRTRAI